MKQSWWFVIVSGLRAGDSTLVAGSYRWTCWLTFLLYLVALFWTNCPSALPGSTMFADILGLSFSLLTRFDMFGDILGLSFNLLTRFDMFADIPGLSFSLLTCFNKSALDFGQPHGKISNERNAYKFWSKINHQHLDVFGCFGHPFIVYGILRVSWMNLLVFLQQTKQLRKEKHTHTPSDFCRGVPNSQR